MAKKLNQPSEEAQKALKSLQEDYADIVQIRNKTYKIKWLKGGTRSKITEVILKDGIDEKRSCMVAALTILNGYWKIKFFYWLLWRWMYYWKEFDESELTEVLYIAKKKAPLTEYYTNTTLILGLRDTIEMMKKTEVAKNLQVLSSHQEHSTEVVGNSPKNTNG